MKIIDIIKEKYKVARKYYETYKHTTECSYYMGYMDALGELLERLEQEEEKKIPEQIDHLIGYDIQQFDDLKEYVEITTNDLFGKTNKVIDILNQVIDCLKSKGE